MPTDLLLRHIPDELHAWIDEQSHERRMSKNKFAISMLREARVGNGTLSLFDAPRVQDLEPTAIPFSFIDLFAGIGGLRFALEPFGGRCVFSSEWDPHSQQTYRAWFRETPQGDITKINAVDIPDHDILAAGFPCQPFSIAGVSKKRSLGRAHGFKDKAQGTLFFHLATIIDLKRPPVLLLENVKNLKSHNGGKTWDVIEGTLDDLGYTVFAQVLDAAAWVPQHRERIFIVGFDRKVFGNQPPYEYVVPPSGPKPKLRSILEANPDPKYTLSSHLWNYLQNYAKKHKEQGNGFGFGLADLEGVSRTLSARYHKDGSEILIPQNGGKNPRRLTPKEAQRLMGFDDSRAIDVSDTQAYRQFGNAVVPPVARAVMKQIVKVLWWHVQQSGNGCLLKPRRRVRAVLAQSVA